MKDMFRNFFNKEAILGIFLVFIFSFFILSNFFIGFSIIFYLFAAMIGIVVASLYPRSAIFSIIFLTVVFEKFFTLQSLIISYTEYKFYLLDVLFLPAVISVIFRILKGKTKINLRYCDLLMSLFLLLTSFYFIFSFLSANNFFSLSFSSFKNYFFYPLFYFLILFLFEKKEDLFRFFVFFLSGILIVTTFIFYGIINGQGLWVEYTPLSTEGARILSFNHGFYLSLAFFVVLSILLIKKKKEFNLFHVLLPLLILGVVGCLMRHLWIASFVAFLFLYVFLIKKEDRKFLNILSLKYTAVVLIIASIFIFIMLSFPIMQRDNKIINWGKETVTRVSSLLNQDDSSISWRKSVWTKGFNEYKDHVFLGIGFGKKIPVNVDDDKVYVEVRNVHNSFLALFIQTGLLGLIIFFSLYFHVFKDVYKKKENNKDLLIVKYSVLSIACLQFIAFMFQPYLEANFLNIFFWINLGLARRYYEGFIS